MPARRRWPSRPGVRPWAVAVSLALATACSGAARRGADDQRPTPRRDVNLVLPDEIALHGGGNLYDVLRALCPAWFHTAPTRMTRGAVMVDPIAIYMDGRRVGPPQVLIEIPIGSVAQVRYYTASEAQGRFGLGNLQGAIDVTTNR